MKLMKLISLLGALICSLYSKERPNVIVVLVDDMGYSDLGSFGGEVKTPNIDRLAGNGLRFTQNYNSCLLYTSPSPRDRTRSRMPSSA